MAANFDYGYLLSGCDEEEGGKKAFFLRAATLEEQVKQSLLLLLTVRAGERLLAPNYGHQLQQFGFARNSPVIHAQLADHIREVISTQERRAHDLAVQVLPIPNQPTNVRVELSFRLHPQGRPAAMSLQLGLLGERYVVQNRTN